MSDLDRFEIFTRVAELASLTRAAAQLNVSKAHLSKQIKQLEQKFNITLFTRHKQRLKLTPFGEILLAQCLKLTRELNDARNICSSLNHEPAGDLHVVAFSYFAEKLIFPKLKYFLEKYPKIDLRIGTTERIPDFMEEGVDLSVGFSLPVPNPGEVIQKRMLTTRYLLCGSPGYFEKKGMPQHLAELCLHQYIEHFSRANLPLRLKPEFDLSLKPFLLLNSVNAMIQCAEQDLGLVQLPLYMIENSIQQGTLVEILSQYQLTNSQVYYHYPKLRYMQPKVRKFIDYFLEN